MNNVTDGYINDHFCQLLSRRRSILVEYDMFDIIWSKTLNFDRIILLMKWHISILRLK